MVKYTSPTVTEEHAIWFGIIVHLFAKCESNMRVAIAGILNIDMGSALIMTGELQYRQLRQTLMHLNNTRGVNGYIVDGVNDALDGIHSYSKLRNWIAHSTWVEGSRPKSIKPLRLITRSDFPKTLGVHHNENTYTPKELEEAAIGLESASIKLTDAMEAAGIFDTIEDSIAKTTPSNSDEGGNPSSK
jgi:hypothetical protein